jgi:hypothetical protein
MERRGWDSNPRSRLTRDNGFQDDARRRALPLRRAESGRVASGARQLVRQGPGLCYRFGVWPFGPCLRCACRKLAGRLGGTAWDSYCLTIFPLLLLTLSVRFEARPGWVETLTAEQLSFNREHILHAVILAQNVSAAGLYPSQSATRFIRVHISSSNHDGCPFCPRRRRAMSNAYTSATSS